MTVIVSRHRFAPDDHWPNLCRHCGRRADAHTSPGKLPEHKASP